MTDIHVLRPQGRLDNVTGALLDDEITKSIADGAHKLLLDMAEISYISSAGLRVILHAAKQMKSLGGKFVICSLNDRTKEVFETSGFSRFLTISASQDDAKSQLT